MSRSSNKSIRLEGWLLKKKTSDRTSLFKSHNNRYFRIQEVKGSDHVELALCYYRNPRDTEAKGWIYLKDICDLIDDKKTFTVISPARTMPLEAVTAAEHAAWVNEILSCSPQLAHRKTAKAVSNGSSKGTSDSYPALNNENIKRFETVNAESKQPGAGGGNLDRLFSRHAINDKSTSFYHPTGSKEKNKLEHMPSAEENEYDEIQEANEDEVLNSLNSRHNHGNHCPNNTSSNNSTGSNSNPLRSSREKEDHRKSVPQSIIGGPTTTSRLHRAIRNDPSDPPSSSSIMSSSYQQQQRQSQTRNLKSVDSESGIEELTLTETANTRGRGRDIRQRRDERRQERASFDRQTTSQDDDDNDDQNDDEDEDDRQNHHRDENKNIADSSQRFRPRPSTEPPVNMAAAAAIVKKAPPPPTSAPPRRAKDALLEADQHQQTVMRRSLDDFLSQKSDAKSTQPLTTTMESDSDSSGDEAKYHVDFKAERAARYQSSLSAEEHTTPDDRPPRHPTSRLTPNSASTTTSSISNSGMMNARRMGTPPRPAADPGMRVDDRFATENWDDDDDEGSESPSPKQIRYRMNNSDAKGSSRSGFGNGSTRDYKSNSATGLAADPNWLDENFDD